MATFTRCGFKFEFKVAFAKTDGRPLKYKQRDSVNSFFTIETIDF